MFNSEFILRQSIFSQEPNLKRREIRLFIMRHYESQHETELTQEEIDMIDNDPQLQG